MEEGKKQTNRFWRQKIRLHVRSYKVSNKKEKKAPFTENKAESHRAYTKALKSFLDY